MALLDEPYQTLRTSTLMVWCLLLIAGCTRPPGERVDAHYPQGLHFYGDRRAYNGLGWEADPNNPQPCPLVLHLPEGNVDARGLADPKHLLAHGWVESYRDHGLALVQYTWKELESGAEKSLAQVTLVKGSLQGVLFRTTGGRSADVQGKRVTLPLTEAELEQLLGKPLRRRYTGRRRRRGQRRRIRPP
jgi:hypothetical protein